MVATDSPTGSGAGCAPNTALLFVCPNANCSARFNPIWEFPYTVEGRQATMVFSSVAGHLMEVEFPEQ